MKPEVFISSTCYDLCQIRADLWNLLNHYGFSPNAFEKNDIPFLPGVAMEAACYEGVRRSDYFILIIGKKYGEESYKKDISIVRQEYRTAIEEGIPTTIFVLDEVYAEFSKYKCKNDDDKEKHQPVIVNDIRLLEFLTECSSSFLIRFKEFDEIKKALKSQWSAWFKIHLHTMRKPNKKESGNIDIIKIQQIRRKNEEYKTSLVLKANSGDMIAQYTLGTNYFFGNISFEVDFDKSHKWIVKSKQQGFLPALHFLGSMYYRGTGVEQNFFKSFDLRLEAVEKGHKNSYQEIAYLYSVGLGCPRDLNKAIYYYTKANESSYNCHNPLAKIYEELRDIDNAIKHYESAAEDETCIERGNAYYRLAKLYYSGYEGGDPNFKKASSYFQKAAEIGNADAKYEIGEFYYLGRGCDTNFTYAAQWYKQAANLGHAEAQYHIAYLYEYGLGVMKNYEKALYWARKASVQGQYWAQFHLGNMYFNGQGLDGPNYDEAFKWLKASADQGNPEALCRLGDLYAQGLGCYPNQAQAEKCYTQAMERGHTWAAIKINKI